MQVPHGLHMRQASRITACWLALCSKELGLDERIPRRQALAISLGLGRRIHARQEDVQVLLGFLFFYFYILKIFMGEQVSLNFLH